MLCNQIDLKSFQVCFDLLDGFSKAKFEFFLFFLCSAVDHFKKQFAFLEEHYGKGGTVAPLERQHASLPRCIFIKYFNYDAIPFFIFPPGVVFFSFGAACYP